LPAPVTTATRFSSSLGMLTPEKQKIVFIIQLIDKMMYNQYNMETEQTF
jgi:hypothetical protein